MVLLRAYNSTQFVCTATYGIHTTTAEVKARELTASDLVLGHFRQRIIRRVFVVFGRIIAQDWSLVANLVCKVLIDRYWCILASCHTFEPALSFIDLLLPMYCFSRSLSNWFIIFTSSLDCLFTWWIFKVLWFCLYNVQLADLLRLSLIFSVSGHNNFLYFCFLWILLKQLLLFFFDLFLYEVGHSCCNRLLRG